MIIQSDYFATTSESSEWSEPSLVFPCDIEFSSFNFSFEK